MSREKVHSECQEIRTLPNGVNRVEQTNGLSELKDTLAKFQAARGKKTSDDKGSDDVTSKAAKPSGNLTHA